MRAWISTADHFRCNDLRRLKFTFWNLFSIRFHWWVKGDPVEYQHQHPWNFLTIVLWGGYEDIGVGRPVDYVRGPCIRYRTLDWQHSVVNVKPHTFSVVITGRVIRPWRFFIWGREVDEATWDKREC